MKIRYSQIEEQPYGVFLLIYASHQMISYWVRDKLTSSSRKLLLNPDLCSIRQIDLHSTVFFDCRCKPSDTYKPNLSGGYITQYSLDSRRLERLMNRCVDIACSTGLCVRYQNFNVT
ncbi:hypothetical protein M3J09_011638 [Ascochyta lentis]